MSDGQFSLSFPGVQEAVQEPCRPGGPKLQALTQADGPLRQHMPMMIDRHA